MDTETLVNKGWFVRPGSPRENAAAEGRTFIISGVARGGTSLAAAVLREGGLPLGTRMAALVNEDIELLSILLSGEQAMLDRAIAERNATMRDWGFKVPNIHAFLGETDLNRFRNPHLVLIFRDPVAIMVRNVIAEYFDPLTTLNETVVALDALVQLVRRSDFPALLVSYEKALIFPEAFADALARFCGLDPDARTRRRMLGLVQPNSEAYVRGARRQFAGAIDMLHDNVLHGWCCQIGELEPVELDLFLDGRLTTTLRADGFRTDLLDAGYGEGRHGFEIDLAPFGPDPGARLSVRVRGRTYEIESSGRILAEYERHPASAGQTAAPLRRSPRPRPRPGGAGRPAPTSGPAQ